MSDNGLTPALPTTPAATTPAATSLAAADITPVLRIIALSIAALAGLFYCSGFFDHRTDVHIAIAVQGATLVLYAVARLAPASRIVLGALGALAGAGLCITGYAAGQTVFQEAVAVSGLVLFFLAATGFGAAPARSASGAPPALSSTSPTNRVAFALAIACGVLVASTASFFVGREVGRDHAAPASSGLAALGLPPAPYSLPSEPASAPGPLPAPSSETVAMRAAARVEALETGFREHDYDARRIDDELTFRVRFTNTGDRALRGVRGALRFIDAFGSEVGMATFSQEFAAPDYAAGLAPGASATLSYTRRFNQFEREDVALRAYRVGNGRQEWTPRQVLFVDGGQLGEPPPRATEP